jgi:hypothetical protein
MKRLAGLFLALILLFGLFPAVGAEAANVSRARPSAPVFSVRSNQLYLDGSLAVTSFIFNRYDFLLVRSRDYSPALLAQCNTDSISQITAPVLWILPDPGDVLSRSTIMTTGARVSIGFNDVLLARTKSDFTANGIASEWRVISLLPSLFAPSTALSQNDLPFVRVTDSSLTVTLKAGNNIYTRFEYAIVPDLPPAGFIPQWIPLGSAYEQDGAPMTAYFLPSGSPFSICVRIEGDDKPGFLFARAQGLPATAPIVLYSREMIGPLSGGEHGSTWYFSSGGGKRWQTLTVKPGEERFIDISKVFGKGEIGFQLRKAETAATPPDAAPIVLEGTFAPRPAFPKSLTLTAFVNEQYPANWTLTGSEEKLEYSTDGVKWTPLDPDTGLPLQTAEQQAQKVKAISYLIRVAADESAGTPASPSKKYTQPKQVKAPSAKPDYKRETIKLKSGLRYFIGDDLPADASAFSTASSELVSIGDALDKNHKIYVFTPEAGKKSRSALQTVILAERGETPDQGEALILNKTSVSLQREFEYYGSKEKWGSFVKGDKSGLVRRKPTARYNAKTQTNTGFAASAAARCEILYSEDGKSVLAIEMERKQTVPLQSWGLSSLSGGTAVYGLTDGDGPSIVLLSPGGTASFSVSPIFASGGAMIDSLTIALNGKELDPSGGVYSLRNLKAGDTVTLSAVPRDRNTYSRTKASIVVVPPLEASPRSVSFDTDSTGFYGGVTVVLDSLPSSGRSRILHVDLVRLPQGTLVHQEKTAVASSSVPYDRLVFDFTKAMTDAGPGSYELRAYFKGTATTSDSVPVRASKTFAEEDFGVRDIDVTLPPSMTEGSTITVNRLRDAFGNDMITAATFQWYRIQRNTWGGGTRTAVTQGGSTASYTLTGSDRGHFMEVLIQYKDTYYSYVTGNSVW